MNVARTILRNIAANWVGFAAQVAVTFLLTPFVIGALGTEAYGIWLLIQSIVGYYGLVDLGLRAGLTQTITRKIARSDFQSIRRHLDLAISLLSLLGLGVIAISIAIGCLLPCFVNIDETLSPIIMPLMILAAATVAIQLPMTPFGAVIVGHQRYDLRVAISLAVVSTNGIGTWIVLACGGGLIGLSLVQLATTIASGVLRILVARRLSPELGGFRPRFYWAEFKELTTVCAWNSIIELSRNLISASDAIVVAVLFSTKSIPPFGIALALVDYVFRIVQLSTRILFPTLVHLQEGGEKETQRRVCITAAKFSLLFAISSAIVGFVLVEPFLMLWLGHGEETQSIRTQGPAIFSILSVAMCFAALQRPTIQLLLASNRLKLLSAFFMVEAVANLVSSFILGKMLGIIGVAVGTLIPALLVCMFFYMPANARILGLSLSELLSAVFTRPIVFTVVLSCAVFSIEPFLGSPTSWGDLIIHGAIFGGNCTAWFLVVGLTAKQRRTLAGFVAGWVQSRIAEREARNSA